MELCFVWFVLGVALLVALIFVGAQLEALLARLRSPKKSDDIAPDAKVDARERPAVERACPYCKDKLDERSVHIECASCSTWHHATCFEENGGCSVYGCREQRGRGVAGVRAS